MDLARRRHLLALVVLLLLAVPALVSAQAPGPVPGPEPVPIGLFRVTDVDFLQGKPAHFDGQESLVPTTPALVMFHNSNPDDPADPDHDELIRLPEWTEGGHREPAALEMGKEFEVFARFLAPPAVIAGSLEFPTSAEVWAESNNGSVPSVDLRRVTFDATGVSIPDVTPEVPHVGLVRFASQGPLPRRRIAVYQNTWTWKAREIRYPDLTVPGPVVIGDTEHVFFAIRRPPEDAQTALNNELPVAPFFIKAVEYSCEFAPPQLKPADILKQFLTRLDQAGIYEYPRRVNRPPKRRSEWPDFSGADAVDFLLDKREGACGDWTAFFIELAAAQGIRGLHLAGPSLRLRPLLPGVAFHDVPSGPIEIAGSIPPENWVGPGSTFSTDEYDTKKWAEDFRTRDLRAVGGAAAIGVGSSSGERRKWVFADHCIAIWARESTSAEGWKGIVFDPTFETSVGSTHDRIGWFEYWSGELLPVLGNQFFVRDNIALGLPPPNPSDGWFYDAANRLPGLGLWTSRTKEVTDWHFRVLNVFNFVPDTQLHEGFLEPPAH